MSYRDVLVAGVVTLMVAGASAATEATKAAAQPGSASDAPAKPAASTPGVSPAAPAASPNGSTATRPTSSPTKPAKAPPKPEKKVDLNNATLAELKTLPTVTEADAKKIIANRPYKSKGELVTKAGLPEGVYQAVRHKVELQKPRTTAPKK